MIMSMAAQAMKGSAARQPAGQESDGAGVRSSEVLDTLQASDFGTSIASVHAKVELEDLLRPQQAIAIVRDSNKALITTSTAGTVYTVKGSLPPGFSLNHILGSKEDVSNFGLVNIKIQTYDLQTSGGSSKDDCLPGPLDLLSVEQWIRRSIAPFVQADGRLKQAVDVTITIYAWKSGEPFRGIWFVGTESGKRCALRDQFIEPDPKAPASPLRAIKEAGVSGRKLVTSLAKKHGGRLISLAAQRLGMGG
jgi:hypothetical protein